MKMTVYPNYYERFRCTADRCRHNCCIGWEIDIDEDTLAYYDMLDGEMGARLKDSILRENQCASFKLDANERCPFLRADNLCEIICRLGEDALCDICTDHPRFRHFFSDRTELGVGLSCESAAILILSMREKMTLQKAEDGEEPSPCAEKDFFLEREALFRIAQQRELPLDERMRRLLCEAKASIPRKSNREWAAFYAALERMDASFDRVIEKMTALSFAEDERQEDEILFEQLLVYFLYRHYTPENGSAAVSFAVHATRLLREIAVKDALSFEETVDLCRLYSSEIEYSEENTEALKLLFEAE